MFCQEATRNFSKIQDFLRKSGLFFPDKTLSMMRNGNIKTAKTVLYLTKYFHLLNYHTVPKSNYKQGKVSQNFKCFKAVVHC